jgi:murE/murF fusion protein
MTDPDRALLRNAERADELARWLRGVLPEGAELRCDSRAVTPGDAFFAWRGTGSDGRLHLADALRRGAVAWLAEANDGLLPGLVTLKGADAEVPHRIVPGLRSLAGEIASRYYGMAAARLGVIAVTGTNGKTTCTRWIAEGLSALGQPCGVIGTLGYGLCNQPWKSFGLTMPDVLSLHAMLRELERGGAATVAMEATSIGLDQGRLDGVVPAVAVLTNLTRDHLDYHGSLEAYAQAKLRLFEHPGLGCAVVNADEPLSVRVLAAIGASCRVIAFGETALSAPHPRLAQLIAERIEARAEGMLVTIGGDFGRAEVMLPVTGRFNVANALAAAASWLAMGVDFERAIGQLAVLPAVPGRLQRVGDPAGPLAVVDYAHTPDALARALDALRPIAQARSGRLTCVFGAGGGRDRGKRPMMGAVAERLADRVVLTSDNPRTEAPEAIIADIASGMQCPPSLTEPDRGRAIEQVLLEACPSDVVLIAGKGHEVWQELAEQRLGFSDVERAEQALARRHRPGTGVAQGASAAGGGVASDIPEMPERLFTLRQAHQWLSRGYMHGEGGEWMSAVVTDSRRIIPGCLFVAVSGERFDGHDFIPEARARGAAAVVYERWRPGITRPAIGVPDSRIALGELAGGWRSRHRLPLAAVTGSNGKTTVKEMLASICRAAIGSDALLASPGNDNNEIGVAQTLLRLRGHHRLAVLELGMNHPGEIAWLAAMARPTVALVNNAQREHQEFIDGTRGSALENAEAFAFLSADGIGVFPGDDPEHSLLWRQACTGRRAIEFGLLESFEANPSGFTVCARSDARPEAFEMRVDGRAMSVSLAIAGVHNVRNALAAAACAHAMGLDLASIRAGLEQFRPVAGRLVQRVGPQGCLLIDDTYNANPDSVRAAIDVLAATARVPVLILGDMGEVGDQGPLWHAEVGAYAREQGIVALHALGEATRESVRAFGPGGRHHASLDELVATVHALLTPDMAVLVKGSRFMRMERVLAHLAPGEAR